MLKILRRNTFHNNAYMYASLTALALMMAIASQYGSYQRSCSGFLHYVQLPISHNNTPQHMRMFPPDSIITA